MSNFKLHSEAIDYLDYYTISCTAIRKNYYKFGYIDRPVNLNFSKAGDTYLIKSREIAEIF